MLHYTIQAINPAAHLFNVTCAVSQPTPQGQRFTLPAWIPGSYMVRDFARHVISIQATSQGRAVPVTKLDKHTWQAAPCSGPLTLHYEIYAWDLSVRGAHLDESHGFFNGSSVFMRIVGQENQPHKIRILPPTKSWRIATTLNTVTKPRVAKHSRGIDYLAANYDELIDHPVEMGTFTRAQFKVHGVLHEVAITGIHDCDIQRLCADLKRICAAQIEFFEPITKQAPMGRYLFLITVVDDAYGGLEHRSSTALICSRNQLPYLGMSKISDGYRDFLGLCSHEYFHTWNIKRIKPANFIPYDLSRENYTRLLWIFEGFTSYYDDLFLLRSGLITRQEFLDILTKTINSVLRGQGRFKQSVTESSFDAWIKYYRQDENAPNAIVSYYTKGSLIALALDLVLRIQSKDGYSLDSVMRTLWEQYGKKNRGLKEHEFAGLVKKITGISIETFLERYVDGTDDLPLEKLLSKAGVQWLNKKSNRVSLGIKTTTENGLVKLTQVLEGGAAQIGGLSAGDTLVAIDGLKATSEALNQVLTRKRPGERIEIFAWRRDELRRFMLTLQDETAPDVKLRFATDAGVLLTSSPSSTALVTT